jgi:hypothetical protein
MKPVHSRKRPVNFEIEYMGRPVRIHIAPDGVVTAWEKGRRSHFTTTLSDVFRVLLLNGALQERK